MNNIRNHVSRPMNDKTSFQGDDLVDFELDAPMGRSLVKGSIEISGIVKVFRKNNTTRVLRSDTGTISMNKNVGAHSLFSTMSCSTQNQGSLEQISVSYPRMVGMMDTLQHEAQDRNSLDNTLEWKFPNEDLSDNFLRQGNLNNNTDATTITYDPAFNIKPFIALNRSDSNIPFSKTGKMKISINLESDEKAIKDRITQADVSQVTYRIEKLRCRYRSVPEDPNAGSIIMEKITPVKATINSTLATLSLNVPTNASSGCSISFQSAANEGVGDLDNNACEKINVSGLQFFYNNANTYLNYKLESISEIIMRGLKSYSPSNDEGTNDISEDNIASNENFVVGTDFDGVISLAENSFEVSIESDVTQRTNVYLYFHSLLNL